MVTDEDPRGEDRERILDEIAAGAEDTGKRRDVDLLLIADRREAIRRLCAARPGDVVVLCGKGHEKPSRWPTARFPWDDPSVAREALAQMGYGEAGAEADAAGVAEGRAVGEGVAKG